MATGWINLSRGEYMDNGVSPRQRKLYILRWNPSISSCTPELFQKDLDFFIHGGEPDADDWNDDNDIYWTVYDWKSVEYMDLFVMVKVGNEGTGIMGFGYLHSYPLKEKGSRSKSRFFRLTYIFMQDPDKTGLLTGKDLMSEIPEVDWMHGHSGELVPVDKAEKLAMLMVKQLKNVEDGESLKFDDFSQKKYVLGDLLTFLCPELKARLLSMGRNQNPDITDINNLMVEIKDKAYHTWRNIEKHLVLSRLNGLMM